MPSTEVAERAPQVPDLRPTPALTITAEDIALPRVYIGQYMSKAVQEQLVKAGQIYSATGQDDPDPVVLWSPPEAPKNAGVKFYVIGLRKGKSITVEGELQTFDFDDPSAPPEAWVTYSYHIVIPSQDADVPYKILFTRTGKSAALQINTVLKKNSISGPAWINAFELTTAPRENAKGKFFVPRIKTAEASKDDVAVAEELAKQMNSSTIDSRPSGEEPAI